MSRRAARVALVALVALVQSSFASATTCHAAPIVASDRRASPSATSLTFATWNAKWLFDGVNDVAASPYANGDAAAASAHADAVRAVVQAVDADCVVIVENETCETLARAANASPAYARGMVDGTDSATQQEVGMLTKIDFSSNLVRTENRATWDASQSSCAYSGSKESGVSKHFWTRISVSGRYVSVIGAHLKANPTQPSSCAQREAQVEVLRAIAKARYDAGDAVIVAGDLNDYSDRHVDAGNNSPTSKVLKRLRDFNDDGVDELEEVGGRIAQVSRYTWQSGSSKAKLDYILTSRADIEVVSAAIRHDLVTSSVSDHFPLVATLDIKQLRNTSLLGTVGANSVTNATMATSVAVGIAVFAMTTIFFR